MFVVEALTELDKHRVDKKEKLDDNIKALNPSRIEKIPRVLHGEGDPQRGDEKPKGYRTNAGYVPAERGEIGEKDEKGERRRG